MTKGCPELQYSTVSQGRMPDPPCPIARCLTLAAGFVRRHTALHPCLSCVPLSRRVAWLRKETVAARCPRSETSEGWFSVVNASPIEVRPAQREDTSVLLGLIDMLADYEKLP